MPAPASKNYVVFSEVKKAVSLLQVLEHYGLRGDFEKRGERLLGCCPIHKGTTANQFKIDLEKNAWYCFGQCKGGGNVLDFVARMEKVSIREAALLLVNWFSLNGNGAGEGSAPREAPGGPEPEGGGRAGRTSNPSLKFAGLKSLNPEHPFLKSQGFEREVVEHFEAGYFAGEGVMKGRLAVPIHTAQGVLVGYAGRALNQAAEYRFPRRFRPELELYNIHRAAVSRNVLREGLYLVKDCLDVWRFCQARIDNVAAVLADHPSPEQIGVLKATLTARARLIWVVEEGENAPGFLDLARLILPRFCGHLVKRVNFAGEVIHDQTEEWAAGVPSTALS